MRETQASLLFELLLGIYAVTAKIIFNNHRAKGGGKARQGSRSQLVIKPQSLNGSDYCAVKLDSDEVMTIGYLVRKGVTISPLGQKYLEEISKYSKAGTETSAGAYTERSGYSCG